MEQVLVFVRLLLAVVLTVAGAAKLADPGGARRAFTDLGGPVWLAPVAAWLLPLVEIAAALALLSSAGAVAGAWSALVLFLVFTGVLGLALARSHDIRCHCFGQLSASPVRRQTLVRTGLLAALAGALVAAGAGGSATWLDNPVSAVLLVVAVGASTCATTWRLEIRRLEDDLRAARPAAGGDQPTVQAPDEGVVVGAALPSSAAGVFTGRPALVLFVSAGCPPCSTLLPDVPAWRQQLGGAADLIVVSRDDAEGHAVAGAFRARWTPAGVLAGSTGRVASTLRYGTDGVRELFAALRESVTDGVVDERALHRRLRSSLGTSALMVGDAAPALPVSGSEDLRHGSGHTLLLFWDPECGYCQGMAGELRQIEAAPPPGTPRVVFVVPRTEDEAGGPQGAFASRSVYDPDSMVAPRFGARGTPSAVLIDGGGMIASVVAVGKDAVLSLLAPGPRAH
jgi:thiol-disulfide isomerase/thioredoxin